MPGALNMKYLSGDTRIERVPFYLGHMQKQVVSFRSVRLRREAVIPTSCAWYDWSRTSGRIACLRPKKKS